MNRTCKVAALFIAYLCFVGFVAAADTIWTPNIIEVTGHEGYVLGEFTCNNTAPEINAVIVFTGPLTYNTQGIADKTVKIYGTTTPADPASWIVCGQNTTDSTGHWTISYTFPIIGKMSFKGGFTP